MAERPDYIRNFQKPPSTELKHINRNWYLYETAYVRDPTTNRCKKKTGRLLGKVTEDGFIRSQVRIQEEEEDRVTAVQRARMAQSAPPEPAPPSTPPAAAPAGRRSQAKPKAAETVPGPGAAAAEQTPVPTAAPAASSAPPAAAPAGRRSRAKPKTAETVPGPGTAPAEPTPVPAAEQVASGTPPAAPQAGRRSRAKPKTAETVSGAGTVPAEPVPAQAAEPVMASAPSAPSSSGGQSRWQAKAGEAAPDSGASPAGQMPVPGCDPPAASQSAVQTVESAPKKEEARPAAAESAGPLEVVPPQPQTEPVLTVPEEEPLPAAPLGRRSQVVWDIVEVGAANFFYGRTKELRRRLKEHFPDLWKEIYTVALLRTIWDGRFRYLNIRYENSLLSHLYPGMVFQEETILGLLSELGQKRGQMRSFMREGVMPGDRYLVCATPKLFHTEDGKQEVSMIWLVPEGSYAGVPVCGQEYQGNAPDGSVFVDMGSSMENCTVMDERGRMPYIVPLSRGTPYVRGRVPASARDYSYVFTCRGENIYFCTFPQDGYDIHLYLIPSRQKEELDRFTGQEGSGRPLSSEAGTLTIKSSRRDLDASTVYPLYCQQEELRHLLQEMAQELTCEERFLRDPDCREAWIFLNWLSIVMAAELVEELASIRGAKYRFRDARELLRLITAVSFGGNQWQMAPLKMEQRLLCRLLRYDPLDWSGFRS